MVHSGYSTFSITGNMFVIRLRKNSRGFTNYAKLSQDDLRDTMAILHIHVHILPNFATILYVTDHHTLYKFAAAFHMTDLSIVAWFACIYIAQEKNIVINQSFGNVFQMLGTHDKNAPQPATFF